MGKPMEATYEVIDGLAVLGGDMILGTEADVAAGDREIRARIAAGTSPATRGSYPWWPEPHP